MHGQQNVKISRDCRFVQPQYHFLPAVSVVIWRVSKVIQFTIFKNHAS